MTGMEVLLTVGKLVGPPLSVIVKWAIANKNDSFLADVHLLASQLRIEIAMKKGTALLDEGKVKTDIVDWEEIVAYALTLVEVYKDAGTYVQKNSPKEKDVENSIRNSKEIVSLLSDYCNELSKQNNRPSGSSSRVRKEALPRTYVRRCLFYLSLPESFVFNRKQIARLFSVREGTTEKKIGDLLMENENKNLIQVVNRWDNAPCYFQIGRDAKKKINTWPERRSFGLRNAFFLQTIPERKEYLPFFCLTFLGPSIETLKLKDKKFWLLTILTLRRVTLDDENDLKKLSLLRYLDLKHSAVRGCNWLVGLQELQLLDLRDTAVESIPAEYLNKSVRLEHLLLGYKANKGDVRLAGAKLNAEKEKLNTKNLKTLRSISDTETLTSLDIRNSKNITDLSVTGLNSTKLSQFWTAIKHFENLTSLGVAVTNRSAIKLQDCPREVKKKLKRLRIKGQIDNGSMSARSRSGFEMLRGFDNLIDLTLDSQTMIDSTTSIPKVLQCLRLYGMSKIITLKFDDRFVNLKKLVIGDMRKLATVQVSSAVIKSVRTLKLCDLPKFDELVLKESGQPLLIWKKQNEQKGKTQSGFATILSKNHFFLKRIRENTSSPGDIDFENCPNFKVYKYDMKTQRYETLQNNN